MINKIIQSGIIEPEELRELLSNTNQTNTKIQLLDGTFVLPGSTQDPYKSFSIERIDQAAFFDINDIADKETNLPHMLPCPHRFERTISKFGITNNDLIVIYGQEGMVMGPARVWWTFRCFGHNNVCVLNGGLPAWKAASYPLNTAPPKQPAHQSEFKAKFTPRLVRNLQDVQTATTSDNSAMILDARPAARFHGKAPEPRVELRSGHMPLSRNLPCVELINSKAGKLKSKDDILNIVNNLGHQPHTHIITTCGSGVTACMIALALHYTGNTNVSVYDGSWAEWGQAHLDTEVI